MSGAQAKTRPEAILSSLWRAFAPYVNGPDREPALRIEHSAGGARLAPEGGGLEWSMGPDEIEAAP
ncbi:hypothetical protein DKG71_00275 [Streptomyces sp. NEAU-S7GS2]|nr:hypothetical protein DKG71_00275 [Streptomyces sp. NEAU-S7GS2]